MARPLVLTLLAALAFASLLWIHHARFENGLVRSFQRQQLESVRSLAGALEDRFAGVRRDLTALAGHPKVCGLTPGMEEILSPYLKMESSILDGLAVLDVQGKVLWSSPPRQRARAQPPEGSPKPLTVPPAAYRSLNIRLPIERDGRQVGALWATMNVYGASVGCQSKADSTYKSLYWLLSQDGEVLRGDDSVFLLRKVLYVLPEAGSPKERLRDVELLPYVTGQCVVAGRSGLAEVLRPKDRVDELVAFAPVNLEGHRFAIVVGSPRAEVSVPIASHERVTYALIAALALLYFGTGYASYRSERSHRRLAEQQRRTAERISRAKGNFLAHMSHELRTPMNGVIAMTDVALGTEDPVEKQRYIGMVKECSNSLLSIVNDILDMSRIEAGKLDLCHVPLNVPVCVNDTLAFLAPLAEKKGLSLRWQIDTGTPSIVVGDPGRLRQVLNNLVGNAIKYTTVGEVTLRASCDSDQEGGLRFLVIDTGPGMSEEARKRAFDAYSPNVNRGAYRKGSTGLGLAIARELVERMGGRIWIDGKSGPGTRLAFTIRFGPIDKESLEAACESFPSLMDLRALVVCGEPSELKRFSNLLQSWGVQTECAADSDGGCSVMKAAADRNEPFRLFLFDSRNASADPLAVAEIMTRYPKHEDAAMVVIYPSNLQVDSVRCLSAGIDAYLGRPFSDEQLYIALRLALQHAVDQQAGSVIPANGGMGEKSLRILLAEDNPVNQKAESLLLTRWGHKVHAVESGEEALSVLKESQFDLVLMDLEMPGMNGIEATAHIRRQERILNRHTPVIAMTAHALDTDRKRCLDAGMDGYVSKPFRPDHLRRLIATIASGTSQKPTSILVNTVAEAWRDLPVWDRSEARRLSDDNDKALRLTLLAFLNDLRQTLPVAEKAAVEKDVKSLARLVHRWKGTLGLLGARRALFCAIRLEEVCGRKEPTLLLECFVPFRDELLSVEKAVRLEIEEDVPCKF